MSDNRKSILMRAYLIYILVLIFGLVIIGKIIYLQWGQGDYWKQQSEDLVYKYENIEARRGNIYADDESLLATSVKIYDVGMDVNPKVVSDTVFNSKLDTLCINLSKMFSLPKSTFLNKLRNARDNYFKDTIGYVLLKRNVTFVQLKKIEKFPIFRLGRLKGGLVVDEREIREFPFKFLAKRTIGYVNLALYDITIDLSKGKIPEDKYLKYADTLSLCMYNLFHDGISKRTYREMLDKSFDKTKVISKRVDGRQLKAMVTFPLLEDLGKENGFSYIKKKDEYKTGLEGAYNEFLSGRDGTRILKKMGAGVWQVMSDEDLVEPMDGFDIYSSIDINLQDVADNALRKCLDSNNAQWGCVVLMEVKTGLVKAMVNLSRDSSGKYSEKINYAVRRQIEPGSTFKLASVIAVLEDGKRDTSSIVPTGDGPVGNRIVYDAHSQGYGYVSMAKAFEKSSNRGISFATYYTFVDKDGHNRISEFKKLLEKMGLTIRLGIDIDKEPDPQIPIRLGDMETIPYGYVVKMTPLQILAFYNAVANKGIMIRPRFVKAIGRYGKILYTAQTTVLKENICSEKTLKKVRKMLEGVVERGTATNINKSVYKIAGKTGTAKIHENGKYIDKYVASFVGYFPADEPKYSCIVIVNRASGTEYTGGQISAPVFKEIADRVYASRLDIRAIEDNKKVISQPPSSCIGNQQDLVTVYGELNFKVLSGSASSDWAGTERTATSVKLKPINVNNKSIPNVTGMGVRDAVYLLEGLGLKVKIVGKGIVKKQSLPAGEKIVSGKEIVIELAVS
jgi:cell division protein FtsI (penicillin-binding protein 3)